LTFTRTTGGLYELDQFSTFDIFPDAVPIAGEPGVTIEDYQGASGGGGGESIT